MLNKDLPITIEIVTHYPFNPTSNQGTFHAYWVEMEMDLKGCMYFVMKSNIFINLPSLTNYDHEEKKRVRYPCLSFTDGEYHKKFFDIVLNRFREYAIQQEIKYVKPDKKIDTSIKKEYTKEVHKEDNKKTVKTWISVSKVPKLKSH